MSELGFACAIIDGAAARGVGVGVRALEGWLQLALACEWVDSGTVAVGVGVRAEASSVLELGPFAM